MIAFSNGHIQGVSAHLAYDTRVMRVKAFLTDRLEVRV
jgi:hypothetical protein